MVSSKTIAAVAASAISHHLAPRNHDNAADLYSVAGRSQIKS
jgi:hypothetical protein